MSTFIWLDMASNYLYNRFCRCHGKSVSPRETGWVPWSVNHLRSLGITFCFFWLWIWLVWISHTSGITDVCRFLVWFISLNIMTMRFIHTVALSELWTLKGWVRFHCVYTSLFMDLAVRGHLDCFCVLASVNHAVVTVTAEICIFSAPFSKPFGYIAWIRIEMSIYSMC